MLTGNNEAATLSAATPTNTGPSTGPSPIAKILRLDWLGQTAASLCWIVSVFVYSFTSTGSWLQLSPGDWLQLAAASCWFVANLAALAPEDN